MIVQRVAILGITIFWLYKYISFYPWTNFLWISDILLGLSLLGSYCNNATLKSMVILGVIFETVWCFQFLYVLLLVSHNNDNTMTHYLFDSVTPTSIKVFSLVYHLVLPVLGMFWFFHIDYQPKALPYMLIVVTIIVLGSRIFGSRTDNINQVYFGNSDYAFVLVLFVYWFFVGCMDQLAKYMKESFLVYIPYKQSEMYSK